MIWGELRAGPLVVDTLSTNPRRALLFRIFQGGEFPTNFPSGGLGLINIGRKFFPYSLLIVCS
jgi:hypothetical protein